MDVHRDQRCIDPCFNLSKQGVYLELRRKGDEKEGQGVYFACTLPLTNNTAPQCADTDSYSGLSAVPFSVQDVCLIWTLAEMAQGK